MTPKFPLPALAAMLVLGSMTSPALAQQAPARTAAVQQQPARPGALGNLGANSKEPIKIDADRLDVFEREGRAVFTGNVVAVQGESTMRCTSLTVLYEQGKGGAANPAAQAPGAREENKDQSIKRLECKGPVTVTSKTQTATSDNAEFDRQANRVVMTGNVALSEGENVTRGDRIVYDMTTGVANVETSGSGGRVRALIKPGSGSENPGAPASPAAKPKPAPRAGQGN